MKGFSLSEGSGGEIEAGGSLTLENAREIMGALAGAVERPGGARVRVADDAVVDISFIQLLCSVHRTAVKRDTAFSLEGSPSSLFARAVKDAGYIREKRCHLGKNGNCLWAKGG